ncbi:hypothetical protein C0989_007180 [Termitomyces sp. Mn162]|nr:hypothetical protein C0989_007180 [Termitomyces sp. Mn162]
MRCDAAAVSSSKISPPAQDAPRPNLDEETNDNYGPTLMSNDLSDEQQEDYHDNYPDDMPANNSITTGAPDVLNAQASVDDIPPAPGSLDAMEAEEAEEARTGGSDY